MFWKNIKNFDYFNRICIVRWYDWFKDITIDNKYL